LDVIGWRCFSNKADVFRDAIQGPFRTEMNPMDLRVDRSTIQRSDEAEFLAAQLFTLVSLCFVYDNKYYILNLNQTKNIVSP
jgi:hypothetical protein